MFNKIGSVKINKITVLAPIAGITNLPFRLLAKKAGCGLVYSEMISANALLQNSPKTFNLLKSTKKEKPLSVQIFGSDPDIMARAAKKAEKLNADIIDINCGCSVKKILKTGAGSALMKNPKKLRDILIKVKKAIKIPLTIKIRSGWCPSGKEAIQIAEMAEDYGVDAIAIHPRTAEQAFKGIANWKLIKKIKNKIKIPIIGNGDIKTAQDAFNMKHETNCDFIMIGRASIENPLIFQQINTLFNNQDRTISENIEKFNLINNYLENSIQFSQKNQLLSHLKKQIPIFLKKMEKSSSFNFSNKFLSSNNDYFALLSNYKKFIFK